MCPHMCFSFVLAPLSLIQKQKQFRRHQTNIKPAPKITKRIKLNDKHFFKFIITTQINPEFIDLDIINKNNKSLIKEITEENPQDTGLGLEILELACMTYKTKVGKLDPVKVLWENS